MKISKIARLFFAVSSTPFLLEIVLSRKSQAFELPVGCTYKCSRQVEELILESCWLTVGKDPTGAPHTDDVTLWRCQALFCETERGI